MIPFSAGPLDSMLSQSMGVPSRIAAATSSSSSSAPVTLGSKSDPFSAAAVGRQVRLVPEPGNRNASGGIRPKLHRVSPLC
jgi:hypothetical protein